MRVFPFLQITFRWPELVLLAFREKIGLFSGSEYQSCLLGEFSVTFYWSICITLKYIIKYGVQVTKYENTRNLNLNIKRIIL